MLDSWASEVGCTTRKRNKWAAHRESNSHRAVVNVDTQDSAKTGIVAQSLGAKQRLDNAVRAIYRLILYVAQKKRPLSDVNDLRALHSIDGNTDLSLDPHVGVLSDPSANYTSEVTLQEMLALDVCVCVYTRVCVCVCVCVCE
jgi:hypothetical protein